MKWLYMPANSQGSTNPLALARKIEIDGFMRHAARQIDQIKRRVIDGQTIPHTEKVFSIFEPHTEWISKGKAGVPVELGVKVCILEDQHQFILHHRVMEQKADDQVTVSMVGRSESALPDTERVQLRQGLPLPGEPDGFERAVDAGGATQKGQAIGTGTDD